jgi:hypothetical protein
MSRDLDYLTDILAAARLAQSYAQGVAHKEFLRDTMRQDAVARQLLVIGEAAKRLWDDFKALHPRLPWRSVGCGSPHPTSPWCMEAGVSGESTVRWRAGIDASRPTCRWSPLGRLCQH